MSGGFVRSGHADGADHAFESGAGDRTIVYLPNRNFNSRLPFWTDKIVCLNDVKGLPIYAAAMSSVDYFHPCAEKLDFRARDLMARNYLQIYGIENRAVDLVVCYAKPLSSGRLSGGTGQTVAIAEEVKIPVLNLFETSVDDIREEIEKINAELNDLEN